MKREKPALYSKCAHCGYDGVNKRIALAERAVVRAAEKWRVCEVAYENDSYNYNPKQALADAYWKAHTCLQRAIDKLAAARGKGRKIK